MHAKSVGLIICISAEAVAHLHEDSSENLLQEGALGPGKAERSNQVEVVGALSLRKFSYQLVGRIGTERGCVYRTDQLPDGLKLAGNGDVGSHATKN